MTEQIGSGPGGEPAPRVTRPLTGDEYVASLRDDREVYIYGERVADVTTHPAFRNPVRMTARLYDALH
ncbi:MAG: 4-hydroxyphenylacetate 3-hydroxylase N-terminal domain-containing protein, partial [Jatrophihabitantaceae bacterium]